MAGKTIYPSIPAPGNDTASLRATVDAMRQTLTMVIMNAQNPSPNYTPSSAAQIFVTQDQLTAAGVKGERGAAGPQGPPGPGIAEAPNDTNTYGRSQLAWKTVLPIDCSVNLAPTANVLGIQVAVNAYAGVIARTPANVAGWGIAMGNTGVGANQQFVILNPSGQAVLWIGSDNVVHTMYPVQSP